MVKRPVYLGLVIINLLVRLVDNQCKGAIFMTHMRSSDRGTNGLSQDAFRECLSFRHGLNRVPGFDLLIFAPQARSTRFTPHLMRCYHKRALHSSRFLACRTHGGGSSSITSQALVRARARLRSALGMCVCDKPCRSCEAWPATPQRSRAHRMCYPPSVMEEDRRFSILLMGALVHLHQIFSVNKTS